MMNYADCMKAYENIDEWQVITSFSVGDFEWLGFSKEQPNKMLCISSQKTTIIDCESGEVEDCIVDYDEQERVAICDRLPNEQFEIVGQFGGELPLVAEQGECVIIQQSEEHIMTITFVSSQGKETVIFENYGAYICGFSYDGNYFVLVDDGGIVIFKRYNLI